jgi:hypothetical protein
MNNPDIRPDDWLPYRARQSFDLYTLACLLHRQDPERLSRVIYFEAEGIPIDERTPDRIAERINRLPEQTLGDAVGGTLATLKKATGASTVQCQVSIDEARRVTAALRLEWPAELDSPRAPTQPTPSASAPAVAVPAPVARPLPRQRHQEAEILRVLRELGHDPRALPRNTPGMTGPKAAAFGRLGWKKEERGVFEKAWDRLRRARDITDA